MRLALHITDPFWNSQAQVWSMQQFLRAYTLHDSSFEAVQIDPHLGILVVVGWDLYWNTAVPSTYHFLGIYFPTPYLSHWSQGSWYQSTLSGATAETVASTERERMLHDGTIDLRAFQSGQDEILPAALDETLTRTRFTLINWSHFEILHNQEVRFGCFDEQYRSITVPM